MNKLLKFLNKYWIILSICATVVSSLVTWGFHLKGRIDKDEDTLGDTSEWAANHEDSIQQLHDDMLKLQEDQRLREKGMCK
jgi:hypothetical protein